MGTERIPESAYRLFEANRYATFATTNPDGSPHISMMWISRDGEDLLFGVESRRLKVRNLRRDPRVSVLVADDRPARGGLLQHLIVRGTVGFEGPDIPERFAAFMDAQSRRYFGTDYPYPNRESTTALIGRIHVEYVSGIGPWAPH
jgi:PPOX class probable F420-dependent enzyme